MTVQKDLYGILSDLFVNLAAGWFGAVFIVSNFFQLGLPANWLVLTIDIVLGILSLVLALRLRKNARRSKSA
ncbi:MAG: hypothetical protein UX80_C0002G0009 [Candidatus Amesbacteria bacterium GW2011_GWA2_47_11b]|uniref:Uncharacterized protein n=3 Tax=Candidatus Amesiibacteriota TaxID=1752730 RepID=A0A0G1SLH6_9BACT|nr:MAG: hypothetical protein UX42_C0001G0125 [Microgenomates group bacterium GW2011_GWC1_46_20]KKU58474.1 MAG: hypothetical protein UX80_C0002G0009 [Candidatus Amesbacteria bacterium GW2011_GWA2_47_11b]KKU70276.1 MAG: hypothetical protein UX92_C0002G0020 [Candidatus Amesbacteria bacterium GW2011_GWA1_47_20]KKU84902.1 MAG: hypothetical protein UY11_C0001G0008 [Candidatus Amesbacteria bacterium GW2011_GWC2_47_8]